MSRILILANNDVGLYKFRKELIEKLIEKNEIFISLPKGHFVTNFIKLGCEFINTNISRRGTNPVTDFKLLLRYKKILEYVKPDVVLSYTIKPNVYGGIACRLTNTPYISNITGLGTAVEGNGILQNITMVLYKVALKKANCVFFQNKGNEKFIKSKGIIKGNNRVIPGSGVNLEQYCYEEYPKDKKNIRFLFIGRIMKSKGIDELLEAAKQIKHSCRNVEFHIVGFCEEDYLSQLKKLDDTGIIYYHGQQDDVHMFIKNSHAIILPSYHEGTSNVLLEAASTGRPVLASNVPGCKETFDEGVSGIGFERKSVSSLVDAITKFIKLPYVNKRNMGKAGRKKMESQYDRKIVVNAYLEQISVLRRNQNGFIRKN